jgi:hypothetical protein
MKKIALLLAVGIVAALALPTSTVWAADEAPAKVKLPRIVRGEVAALAGRALAVKAGPGLVLIVTGSETAFRVPGVDEPTIEDVDVGDHVIALGQGKGWVLRAQIVSTIDPDAEAGRVGGQVTLIDGFDITLNTLSGDTAVVRTDADTLFRIPGVDEPGLADVAVGNVIVAGGTQNDDGSWQAILVFVPHEMERRLRLVGEVTEIEGATLSLHTRGDRQVQLLTDDETVFRVPGVEEAGLDDIQVGNRVLSVAQTREGDLYARQVIVPPQGMPRVAGEVTEIEGQTLVLETPRGAVQALTDGDTVFRVPGVEEATLADVTPGDQVVCAGAWQDPGTFAARIVQVRPPR